jgi:DNA repair protein RecN (Recombination protein N)
MRFTREHAEYLSLGSLLLGCGGGGNVQQGINAYEAAFRNAEERGNHIEVITIEELAARHPEGGVIVTISGVGSPASPTSYTPPEYYPRLMELLEKRRNRLADLEGKDEKLREFETAAETALAKVRQAGAKLSAARKKAGTKLSAAITKELRGLGFLQAGFSTAITEREPDAHGCDCISFLFEPNPGEHARALSTIASTGEIARVMLAVKTVTAAHDSIPVLVFDEIDSNIGGETGRAVGIRLKTVARKRQVVAITHLPQSAAYGDRHFVVEKSVSGGRTRSAIREVSGEERIREITRMLGGENASSVAAQHARELLEGAKT